jgi:hypothetical protein
MRYIVRISHKGTIANQYFTNDYNDARAKEIELKDYGYEEVWICDCLDEILVG